MFRGKSFAVFAATATEKQEWMAHINKCIEVVCLITPLPAQISASNFHDLTQITQRRVRFNPKRTVFPCALGKSTLCGHKSNLYMPSKWLIIVFQRGPRDPPYTSSSSLVRVWWQMSQWPQLALGSHSSPQPSSVTCKAM